MEILMWYQFPSVMSPLRTLPQSRFKMNVLIRLFMQLCIPLQIIHMEEVGTPFRAVEDVASGIRAMANKLGKENLFVNCLVWFAFLHSFQNWWLRLSCKYLLLAGSLLLFFSIRQIYKVSPDIPCVICVDSMFHRAVSIFFFTCTISGFKNIKEGTTMAIQFSVFVYTERRTYLQIFW